MQKRVMLILILFSILFIVSCANQKQQAINQETAKQEIIQEEQTAETQEIKSPSQDTASQEQKQRESFYNSLKKEYTDKEFPGLQGVCKTLDECKQICMPNPQLCLGFCMENPQHELCLKKHQQSSGKNANIPGKCSGYEECGKYCDANPEEPDCKIGKLYEPAIPNISAPFAIEQYSPIKWGLWPFCVHGGDHPEGHGGIDFELKANTKIYSGVNGTVVMTEDVAAASPEEGGGLAIQTEKIAVIYYGIVNRQVQKGQNVTAGQYIGDAVKLPAGEYFIHFEVNNFPKEQLVCPLNYLDENFKKILNEMHKKSHYPEIAEEPNLCSCENLPYKPTMTKGPQK